MIQYRAALFKRQRTRWRATREEALADAVKRGWGSLEDHPLAKTYLGVGVVIESR